LSLRESADGLVARHAASALELALGVIEAGTFALIKSHVVVGDVDTADRGKAVTSKSSRGSGANNSSGQVRGTEGNRAASIAWSGSNGVSKHLSWHAASARSCKSVGAQASALSLRNIDVLDNLNVLVVAIAVQSASIVGSSNWEASALLRRSLNDSGTIRSGWAQSSLKSTALALSVGLSAIRDGEAIAVGEIGLTNISEVGLNSAFSSGDVTSSSGIGNNILASGVGSNNGTSWACGGSSQKGYHRGSLAASAVGLGALVSA
jgi:hypothetical protein